MGVTNFELEELKRTRLNEYDIFTDPEIQRSTQVKEQ